MVLLLTVQKALQIRGRFIHLVNAGFLPVLGVMNYMELGRMRDLDCPSLGAFILAESFSQGVHVFCKNDVSFVVYRRP